MKKYLIISPLGDKSICKEWLLNIPNFDIVFLYYGDNFEIPQNYLQYTPHIYSAKGTKYSLIKSFIQDNLEFISQYTHIWLPDDDVSISTDEINRLFEFIEYHNLSICQPSMGGYVSHEITKQVPNSLLRYTNFVEVLAPMFNLESLLKVYETFDENYSSWGFDYLWAHLLNYPQDKIAIIDDIIMIHTKPVGQDYSHFPRQPWDEMVELLSKYNIIKQEINYSQIWKK
jgi:hypothetical protein